MDQIGHSISTGHKKFQIQKKQKIETKIQPPPPSSPKIIYLNASNLIDLMSIYPLKHPLNIPKIDSKSFKYPSNIPSNREKRHQLLNFESFD